MSLLAAVPIISKALDLIFPDPKVAMEHKIAVLRLEQEGAFKQLDAEVQLALAQIAVNAEEAKSDSLLKSGWRPAVDWICGFGLGYQLLFRPIFGWIAQLVVFGTGDISTLSTLPLPPALEMETLLTLLGGLLGFGGFRMAEKIKGKA